MVGGFAANALLTANTTPLHYSAVRFGFGLIGPASIGASAPIAAASTVRITITQVVGIAPILVTPSVSFGTTLNGRHRVCFLTVLNALPPSQNHSIRMAVGDLSRSGVPFAYGVQACRFVFWILCGVLSIAVVRIPFGVRLLPSIGSPPYCVMCACR